MKNKKSKKSEKKLSQKSKKILICTAAGILLLLIAGGIFLFTPSKNFTIAFYRVDEKQRQGITQVINDIAAKNNIQVLYVEYNPEKSLKDELPLTKKPNIVLTTSGFALETAVDKASKKAVSIVPGGLFFVRR